MNPLRDSSDGIPLHLNRQLDALCDEFESQLAGGALPPLSEYLPRIPAAGRRRLLEELVNMASEELERRGADPVPELAEANPELATELQEILGAAVNGNEEAATAFYEPAKPREHLLTPRRKRSRGLHIRCPHCSNHVELIGDTPSEDIDCTVCGSSFSLVDRSKETRMAEALQKIDRFELISRLGVGGFGTVWKARDIELDRAVAVKIPRHGQLTDEEMEQFFREARSVAQLRHPNIVPVHEVGREGDAVFIVSDLIRGVSLADVLTGKQFDTRETAELIITITDGLEHAHKRGVIHRDLKPSNIMIDDDDKPHLMDFGLAKREAEEVTMTTEGQIVGTPAYMSPEQADGKSAWVDRRTDVYSIGIILFELLTGELPFRGNAQMQVRSRLTQDAPDARSLNRHLPIDLATICAKCLEREPGRRYQTAQEIGDELRRFLKKEPIKARPLSPIGRAARWVERRPLQATLAMLVVILAVGGPLVAAVINHQRLRLKNLVDEKNELVETREAEKREAIARAAELRSRLDTWEGKANPWSFWPPNPGRRPLQEQIGSLLRNRGQSLRLSLSDSRLPPTDRAMAAAALAQLYESKGDTDQAIRTLRQAVETLFPPAASEIASAAHLYEELARLTSTHDRDASTEWLRLARKARRKAVENEPTDARSLALGLRTELRGALSDGFGERETSFKNAARLNQQLDSAWPTSAREIYLIVCELNDLSPVLILEEAVGAPKLKD